MPPTMVAPLLDIPGKRATAWNKPIIMLSNIVIWLLSFLPLKSFIKNNAIAVIIRAKPTNLTLSDNKSILSFKNIPSKPAGIVPITINQAYL